MTNEIPVETNRIPRVTAKWLQQKKNALKSVHGGEANERYAGYVKEIEDAEEQDRKAKDLDDQAAAKGFSPNQYPGKCSVYSRDVAPYQGYVKKINGRWVTYSVKAALES